MQFGETKVKKFNRSQKFVGAAHVAQEEGTVDQQKHRFPHAQGPYGVFPQDTWPGKQDYVTTSSRVAPNNAPDDPSSLASRIAHRRVAVCLQSNRLQSHRLPDFPCMPSKPMRAAASSYEHAYSPMPRQLGLAQPPLALYPVFFSLPLMQQVLP